MTSKGALTGPPSPTTTRATGCTVDHQLPQPSAAAVLQAHKGQPMIEKRFEQIKTVHEIAPVLLKNEGRIEAMFTVYFLALLLQALIERELRPALREPRSHSPAP